MPIEIRELHIRATIEQGAGPEKMEKEPGAQPAGDESKSAEELIATCVEKVLQILQQKTER